ncbi:putative ABC transporter permease [Spirochaeta africana]|uniref:Putative membrane protein n=1 Tax=Spirochaeta africana (strain ATCC 700263 / DSM 8902 / Z-7692) TaxID=889378 RepID=H9UIS0_SPIAZ|nr:putative ABC transporter permease [Spirochaeta africana]AFG37413.1 putative membrane protein [Spirochaeta africana DSM 8902]
MQLFSETTPLWIELVAVFTTGGIFGWLLEVGYRSFHARRLVNPGLLYGPVVPLYGFGLVMVLYGRLLLDDQSFLGTVLLLTLAVTLLEYLAGALAESLIGIKLWDYSDRPLNLQGRICFQFSLYWFVLIGVVSLAMDAIAVWTVDVTIDLGGEIWEQVAIAAVLIMLLDGLLSVISLVRLRGMVLSFRDRLHAEIDRLQAELQAELQGRRRAGEQLQARLQARLQRRLRHVIMWSRRFPAISRQLSQQLRSSLADRRRHAAAAVLPEEFVPGRRFTRQRRELQEYLDGIWQEDLPAERYHLAKSLIAAGAAMPVRARRVVYAVVYPDDPRCGWGSLRPSERLLVNLLRTRVS